MSGFFEQLEALPALGVGVSLSFGMAPDPVALAGTAGGPAFVEYAGAVQHEYVAGPVGQLNDSISPGYGFTAIIVAFLGRLHPIGVAIAGVVVALSYIGGENAQIMVGMPLAVTGVFQGMLLFFLLGSDLLIRYRVRLWRPAAKSADKPVAASRVETA